MRKTNRFPSVLCPFPTFRVKEKEDRRKKRRNGEKIVRDEPHALRECNRGWKEEKETNCKRSSVFGDGQKKEEKQKPPFNLTLILGYRSFAV